MESSDFDHWSATLRRNGADAALDELLDRLLAAGELHRYFDALALRARHRLGLPTLLPAELELPHDAKREQYEKDLTNACREVGERMIRAGDFAGAYRYLGTIGELEPLRAALDSYDHRADDDDERRDRIETVVELAIGQAIHPAKGLAIILDRSGVCPAITAAQGIAMQDPRPAVREDCAKLLVSRIHQELGERVRTHIQQIEGDDAKFDGNWAEILDARPWLFEDDNYHIDTSHLNSVVRFARFISAGNEIQQAIELCEYGTRLSDRYRYGEPAPFEDIYRDTMIYLRCVAGLDVAAGLAHFRQKAVAANTSEGEHLPIEVYVGLLLKFGRADEAIAFAGKHLNARGFVGNCPSVDEICRRFGRFGELAEFAKSRGDLVSFAAAQLHLLDAGG